MKFRKWIFLFFSIYLQVTITYASGGCSGSGCGGDFSAAEFQDIAIDSLKALKSIASYSGGHVRAFLTNTDGEEVEVKIDPKILARSLSSVSVRNETLYLDGKPVSFLSNPESGHVDFSKQEWANHKERAERMRMVVHELLMLSSPKNPAYDDYKYFQQLSRELAKAILKEEKKLRDKDQRAAVQQKKNHCMMIYAQEGNEIWNPNQRLFFREGNTQAEAVKLVRADCKQVWPRNLNASDKKCEDIPVSCDSNVASQKKFSCTISGGYYRIAAVGKSRMEAEYLSRQACFSAGSGKVRMYWFPCLTSSNGQCHEINYEYVPGEEESSSESADEAGDGNSAR